ncbi:hypothetical protein LTR56_003216 [Elasticomyces elasticus]|nr:hypothetical protein LTR22_010749 [Elasticomyces elasticus]KAK3656084.1 hypothetical protein LTR56_003216 [Elasticomyces elasticus]KAK4920852.1 hypothetical protein LTR49_011574 [Elasticomyces elasticus]KAK5759630.1 hypothetical protein LTS12_010323 [Elasticomyces elasticus]
MSADMNHANESELFVRENTAADTTTNAQAVEQATVKQATVERATIERATVERATVEQATGTPQPKKRKFIDLEADTVFLKWLAEDEQEVPRGMVFSKIRQATRQIYIDGSKLLVGKRGSKEYNLQKELNEKGEAIGKTTKKDYQERAKKIWPTLLTKGRKMLREHENEVSKWEGMALTRRELNSIRDIVAGREERLQQIEAVIERAETMFAEFEKHLIN